MVLGVSTIQFWCETNKYSWRTNFFENNIFWKKNPYLKVMCLVEQMFWGKIHSNTSSVFQRSFVFPRLRTVAGSKTHFIVWNVAKRKISGCPIKDDKEVLCNIVVNGYNVWMVYRCKMASGRKLGTHALVNQSSRLFFILVLHCILGIWWCCVQWCRVSNTRDWWTCILRCNFE